MQAGIQEICKLLKGQDFRFHGNEKRLFGLFIKPSAVDHLNSPKIKFFVTFSESLTTSFTGERKITKA
jgi:hypothetical protein